MSMTRARRALVLAATALAAATLSPAALAQSKVLLRISTPAVPDDWHGKMWTVFKDALDKSAPGEFDVQINLNATLFKQGTEPAAMARGGRNTDATETANPHSGTGEAAGTLCAWRWRRETP